MIEFTATDISIVIITRNRAALLKKALERLIELNERPKEIIVVDNASTDTTRSVIENYQSTLPIVYSYEAKKGVGHARNNGIKLCKGEIISFMDDDCFPPLNWLSIICDSFNAFDEISVLGGPVIPKLPEKPKLIDRFFYDLYRF